MPCCGGQAISCFRSEVPDCRNVGAWLKPPYEVAHVADAASSPGLGKTTLLRLLSGPGYRFWPFQFIETGIFVALAAALIAVTFLVVRRRDA